MGLGLYQDDIQVDLGFRGLGLYHDIIQVGQSIPLGFRVSGFRLQPVPAIA